MNIPWAPIIFIDITGSVIILLIAFWSETFSRQWTNKKPDDVFRQYIYLLTLAIVFFAVSRSFGHLVKQVLLLNDMAGLWNHISPFSGAINTVAFIVIFAFGIYFHRFQKVHQEIEKYQNNLEEMITIRTDELEESKLALETILNNSNPICITSIDYNLIQANDAYYAIWPQAGLSSRTIKCYDSRPGKHCHTSDCPLRLIVDGKDEVITEVAKIVDGIERVFIITSRPILDAAHKLIGMVESFQDITKRKKAELALASERERLAVTLKSIGDGVITTDLAGRVTLINRVAEQLTGWSQQEAIGKPVPEIFNIINEITGKPANNPVDKIVITEKVTELDNNTTLISRDGTNYSIEDSGAPICDENSKVIGSVIVFRDVTEKKKTEEELQKIKKLESVGVLAGGIAHDFNNILAAISGNIELSLIDAELSKKSQHLLSQAQKATFRARDLTQQLLTFAKGGQPIKETASLAEIVKDSADFVLRGTKVACHYAFPDDLWLVDIDKGQISQVVQNIILNASDAMPDGGKIEVSCRNISVANPKDSLRTEASDYVELQITDTGIGIPQDALDKIFDPYFSTKQKGSGLGLAITHSIISKHDGRIDVRSTPGIGTTFTIELPAGRNQSPTPARQKTVANQGKKHGRILVMDDEEAVREVTRELLLAMGHDVLLAKDGKEALQLYQAANESGSRIDLSIMDLTIPGGLGGKETIQQLLSIDPQAKVIVSSGYSTDPVMAKFKEFGFSSAISKPHRLSDLEKVVNQLLA